MSVADRRRGSRRPCGRRPQIVVANVTDRGPVRFLLDDSDDIRRLGPHRAILLDVHGGRYYVTDSRQLDPRSQQILARYL